MNNSSTSMLKRNLGFTLIEVMIVVVIVGILAAIAYPSYTEFVKRGHQTEAQGQIMELASALEALRAKNFSYNGATVSALAPALENNRHYSTKLDLGDNDQTYKITATPSTTTMSDMPELSLTSNGTASWD